MTNIGQTITTAKSGIVGKVVEVVANPSGTERVRIVLADGSERWTTVSK